MTEEQNRQYVAVKFRKGDSRSYTYHNDGNPVRIGDEVKVPDRELDSWKRVEVVDLPAEKPQFETKAILGLAPPRQEDSDGQ